MSRLFITTALAAILCGPVVRAQDNPEIRLPGAEAEIAPVRPAPSTGPLPAIGALSRDVVAPGAAERTWKIGLHALQPLPAGRIAMGGSFPEQGILRVTGEVAEIPLGLTLPADVVPPAAFRLALRSSVNDLPARSEIAVTVNGEPAGTWPLDQIGGWGAIDVPGTALRGGDNVVALSLRQHHRIFCGPEASFGVWTEIDLAESGVALPAAAIPLNARSFAAALANAVRSGQPIDLRMQDGVPTEALAAVTGALRDALPDGARIGVATPYDPVGPSGRQVGISLRRAAGGEATAAFLRDAGGALIMQITDGTGLADLMARTLPVAGPDAGPGALVPGQVTRFADLGVPSFVRNTRYAEAEVAFTLPRDWMDLSSRKALLTLDYGYADDLPQGSILLVKANGETIILLPLDVEGGGVLPSLPVRFPARLLHGGENRLSFEMIVPGDPPDIECPARDSDMLAILDTSSLSVPPTPPMTFGGSGNDLRAIGPEDVAGIAPDPAYLRSFVAQLALTPAGAAADPARLRIARMPQDFAALHGDIALDRESISRLFQTPAAPDAPSAPASFRLSETAAPDAPSEGTGWADLRSALLPETETLADWLRTRSAKAVLMAPTGGSPDWTLVADGGLAPADIAATFDAFRQGTQAQGAEVALWTGDGWEVWPTKPMPLVTGAIGPRDIFLVLGNYASWAPGYYAILLVVLALLSAIPAYIFVLSTRGGRS